MPWEQPTLAEAGKIKIGMLGEAYKTRNGGSARKPVKLDHFIVTTTRRDAKGDLVPDLDLMSELESLWGDADGKLRNLPVVLDSDDLGEVFTTLLAYYNGKKRLCYGDGRTATRGIFNDKGEKTGERTVGCPCDMSVLVDPKNGRCKPLGTLNCSIRVPGYGLFGSSYRWRTTSSISIKRMMGSLKQVQNVVGSLRGVPLVLVLTKVDLAGKAPVFCCHLELREQTLTEAQKYVLAMASQRQEVALAAKGQPVRLKVLQPGDEDERDQAEVAEEFHPEDPAPDQSETGHVGQDDLT